MSAAFRVTVPAESRLLTTVARMKQDLTLLGTETDAFLTGIAEAASAAIARYFNDRDDGENPLTLGRETIEETFRALTPQAVGVSLGRRPVAEIESVTEDGIALDYRIDDGEGGTIVNPDWPFFVWKSSGRLERLDSAGAPTPFTAKVVTVVYKAGWLLPGADGANLPEDIQSACLRLCSRLLDQTVGGEGGGAIKSESFPGIAAFTYETARTEWSGGLPADIAAGLAHYKRKVIA